MSDKDKSKEEPKQSNDDWTPGRREERDLGGSRGTVDLKKRSK